MGLFALASFTVLVLLQTSNVWKRFSVETASDTLLLYALSSLNFIALVIFGFIFLRSIVKLMRERRAFQLGSRLKTKLLVYFVAISILPIFAMAGFSYLFMNRALERWFTQIPENVVRAPVEIEKKANAERLESAARMLASTLDREAVSASELDAAARAGDLAFVQILNNSGQPVTSGSVPDDLRLVPEASLMRQGQLGDPSLRDGSGIDIAVAEMSGGRQLLVASNPLGSAVVSQMVNDTLSEFDRLKERDVTVRQIGLLTLGVLTFLLIFASTWTAFYIARGLTVPIRSLAEGAEKIAEGKLGHRVNVVAEDELALLVTAFNEMSTRLEENSAELTERRRYIETVLLSLPTGVISVDAENHVGTINPAARAMLKLERAGVTGSELGSLLSGADRDVLDRLIARARRVGHAADQTKLHAEGASGSLDGEGMPVAITATALPEGRGAVLVLEDLSELIAAQRASAWQEVARRMAHEIKNPLTPIQLSAERIAKRFKSEPPALAGGFRSTTEKSQFGPTILADDPNSKVVLDGTDTILREVQSLKSMVDEFSRFARLPEVKLEPGSVNEIVKQAADLYLDRTDAAFDLKLTVNLPKVMVDEEQLRRVFVNLIDNAIEAPRQAETPAEITISTRHDAVRDLVVAEVCDNGNGIDAADYQKLFQPYFSTKGRGTGLGLAIVNRIVTEHNGKIKAVPNMPKGAKFIVELPLVS